MLFRVLAIEIVLHIFATYINANYTHLIFGGKPANIKDVPWQVAFLRNGYQFCGGSIIGKMYVLTAAHCLDFNHGSTDRDGYSYSVMYGSHDLRKGGKIVEVADIIIHPEYNRNNIDNDIAVLVLKNPIKMSKTAQPIKLRRAKVKDGEHALVSGFGKTENESAPTMLLKTNLHIIKWKDCVKAYGGSEITHNMVCAIGRGKDSCVGDSGGPLVIKNRLVGIVSWGSDQCADKKLPGVYTNVANYKNFIQKATKNSAKWS